MLQILPETEKNIVATTILNKLTQTDYAKILPLLFNVLCKYTKIRWYIEMEATNEKEINAYWEENNEPVNHAKDFEKIALVGKGDWRRRIAGLMKPFATAEIKFFGITDKEKAKTWITE